MANGLKVPVLGTCLQMCPESERKLRIKNNMIHTLEKSCDSGKKNDYLLIKSFSRSAAGNTRSCDPKEIRPPYICRRTTNYLIENVLFRNGGFYSADFKMDLTTYHFVFDRLRAVRQDMIVQRTECLETETDLNDVVIHTHILQVCIKFHLLAHYLFCTNHTSTQTENQHNRVSSTFDSHINFSHMLECLKMILNCFEILYPRQCDSNVSIIIANCNSIDKSLSKSEKSIMNSTRIDMIVVYLLLNLGSYHSYKWGLELDSDIKNNEKVTQALKLNSLYSERNFVRLFKEALKLPLLYLLAFHWNLPVIYKELLMVMNTAYSSKNCNFPATRFAVLFGLEGVDEEKVISVFKEHDIKTQYLHSGAEFDDDTSCLTKISICFDKSNFNMSTSFKWQEFPQIGELLTKENLLMFFFDSLVK